MLLRRVLREELWGNPGRVPIIQRTQRLTRGMNRSWLTRQPSMAWSQVGDVGGSTEEMGNSKAKSFNGRQLSPNRSARKFQKVWKSLPPPVGGCPTLG